MKTAAAAVLLLAAAWWYRQQLDAPVADETGNPYPPDDTEAPTMLDNITASAREVFNAATGTDAAGMRTSPAGLAHLQQFESLSLTPYRLGDGGQTIGWGRYYPDSGPPPPARIDRATADAWFAADVVDRAEKWVKAYVTAPLLQPQFDALVSMAYNLSPRSFKTIADAVNAGDDPEAAALRYVRAGSNLERGLRRRRASELAMFRADPAFYG